MHYVLLLQLTEKQLNRQQKIFLKQNFIKTEDLLTQMGIGEALVTLLNEKGIPTPLVHTMLCPPRSRMDILSDAEIDAVVSKSKLASKYNREINNESAYEILNAKLEEAAQKTLETHEYKKQAKESKRPTKETSFFDNPAIRQVERTAASVITRSLLGALGLGGRSRRRSRLVV
jgi:hypothetical protein